MITPSISIITIVYNGLPFLKESVASVLKQEYQDWELLISDDGSTDGSREFLDTLSDSRITIYKQEKNLGIFGNLNFLFGKAKAPISQILCQDDYFLSNDSLTCIIEYWKTADKELGYVRFNHQLSNRKQLVKYQDEYIPPVIKSDESAILFYIFGNIPGNLSNVSVRTELIQKYGGFDQRLPFAGDFEFWRRLSRNVDMGVDKRMVVYVRRHPGVASNYLNLKGELLEQIGQIVSPLYNSLIQQYPEATGLLKILGTLNYDALSRDTGVKRFVQSRDKTYLKRLNNVSNRAPYAYRPFLRWILYFASFGGRMGRVFVAKRLIQKTNFQLAFNKQVKDKITR